MNDQNEQSSYTRRVLVTVTIVAITGLGLWLGGTLLSGFLIIFAGILFGVFLSQLSKVVAEKTGWKYGAALSLVVMLLLLLAAATLYFMGSRINQQISTFAEQFSAASDQARERVQQQGWIQWLTRAAAKQKPDLFSPQIIQTASSFATIIVSAIAGLILAFVLGFYFALQAPLYRRGVLKLCPKHRRERIDNVLNDVVLTLWWWILGRLVGMAIIGIGSGLGLRLMGIPLPATLGVIAALLNFVPNFGPLLAAIPAVLFALQQGTNLAIGVAAFYLALQFVESYLITPLIDQQQVQLPPGLILASQLLFGLAAGFLGLLLATPLTAVIYILVREFYVQDVLNDT